MASWRDLFYEPDPDPDLEPPDSNLRMLLATCWTILALLAYSISGGVPGGWHVVVAVGKSGLSMEAGRRDIKVRVGRIPTWPDATTTGVPAGTTLTAYTGPCLITTANTVIDSKTVDCAPDGIAVHAANVVIRNSMVTGLIRLDTDLSGAAGWSVSVTDSEVDATEVQLAAICCGNLTVTRVNVHGGITAVQCEASGPTSGGDLTPDCIVRDSYLHGQGIPVDAQWHLGGFLTEGGDNHVVLDHNYVICNAAVYPPDGGCTGDINLLAHFGIIHDVTINNNKLGATPNLAYCTFGGSGLAGYGPETHDVVYTNNVFERGTTGICGQYGPVTDFDQSRPGNVWTNNKYDDGTVIPPPF
jgi:hypothetical protein